MTPFQGKKWKEAEEYPNAYPKDYQERVEKFSRNYIWRMITGDITPEFLEAVVDRMFNADEVTTVVDLARLQRLKREIVSLFLPRSKSAIQHRLRTSLRVNRKEQN